MSLASNDVEIGWLYKTPNNQERVVLGCNIDCKVVYASRGGNVKNAFDHREASTAERFAEACSEKIKKLSEEELQKIISDCNATNVIVAGNACCFEKN